MYRQDKFVHWYFDEFRNDPLFEVMAGLAEESPWHREQSVGVHTNMVVTQYLLRSDDIRGAFAAAFHDVGKPGAIEFRFKPERGNYKAFPGHELLSARLWEDWAVRHWQMLRERFEFEPRDIYRVGWLIEHHLPWQLKDPRKLAALASTAVNLFDDSLVFQDVLLADQYGRISDDHEEKLERVSDWLSRFEETLENLPVDHKPPSHPYLIMPIGASGSGKSNFWNHLGWPGTEEFILANYFSLDKLRHDWYDADDYTNAYRKSVADKGFGGKAQRAFIELLKEGKGVYVDNTNLSRKRRRFYVTEARNRGYYTIAVLFPVTLDTVVQRQASRTDKTVPEHAVIQHYNTLQLPMYGEFDEVLVVDSNLPGSEVVPHEHDGPIL